MISQLIEAEVDGQKLTDQDIINFVRILLPAGAETTSRSTSNLLFALLTQPDQWEALRADPSLIDAAIEEGLRWEAPLTSLNRVATGDTEIAGVAIPKGAIVACSIGAANRAHSRWERPDDFDLHRPSHPHLAFAFGPHTCLGMHLARLETRVVLEELLQRLPDLHLDLAAPPPEIRGIGFRSAATLPVRFTPEKASRMTDHTVDAQIEASDWTDNDLLTITEALARLTPELGQAEIDLGVLRTNGADEDLVQMAQRRIEAIETRIKQLTGPDSN
jgi:cytochrome P450